MQRDDRQLRSQSERSKHKTKDTHARLRQEIGELDRKIGLQLNALEHGVEPELVGERIAELRVEKEQAEAALTELGASALEELREGPCSGQGCARARRTARRCPAPWSRARQIFEAFCLEVRYDKVERRIEVSATVSEAVANAFENAKDLPEEVSSVTTRDIAGARYVPPSDARVVERFRPAALTN